MKKLKINKKTGCSTSQMAENILGISWTDRITNVEVRTRTGQQTMDNILREKGLRWLGHVLRIDHQCIPQQALHWQVPGFKRGPGRPTANWKTQSTKTYKRWGSPGKKQTWQLLTDMDGIGVWPKCPVGCGMNQGPRSHEKSAREEIITDFICHPLTKISPAP